MGETKLKVLVVDDNKDNLLTLNALIKEAFPQADVIVADNGKEGIEKALILDPDVILLDIVMPGMDGFEVCRELKNDENLKDIPVVFVTALKGDKENRIKALEVGAEAFLSKPIDETELVAQIRAMKKIKEANVEKKYEKEQLAELVYSRTKQLEKELKTRREAETELIKSEENFRNLVNKMQLGLAVHEIILDDEGIPIDYLFLDVNPAFEVLTGLKNEDVKGKTVLEILPGTEKIWIEKYGHVTITGEPVQFEQYSKELGRYYSVVAYRPEENKVAVIIEDVTKRKKAEEALREKEAFLARSQEIAHTGSWKLDLHANRLTWSDEVYRIFGFKPQEFVITYEAFLDFVHPDDRAEVDEAYSRSQREGSDGYEIEHRIVRRNSDEVRCVYERCVHERDAAGVIIQSTGMVRDITEQKKAEEELKKSEASLQAVLNSTTDGILAIGKDKKMLYANERFSELWRIPSDVLESGDDSILQQHILDQLSDPEGFLQKVQELYSSDRESFDTICFHDGRIFERLSRPLMKELEVIGRVWSFRDITEQKKAEKELVESEVQYRMLFDSSVDAIMTLSPPSWSFTSGNPATVNMFGVRDEADFTSRAPWEYSPERQPDGKLSKDKAKEMIDTAMREGSNIFEWTHRSIDGKDFPATVLLSQMRLGEKTLLQATVRDNSYLKLTETYRKMAHDVLQILNEPVTLQESIQRILDIFKTRTGVDAVGIRLQEGEDFPYFVQDGFPKDFLLTENTLLERDRDGGLCRDKDGNVSLECTCGLVISGKTDPSNPLFTKGGSSFTNDSFPLLDLPSDEDPRLHPRNNCIHQGYASVALIPIQTKDRIVGLIQLNDKSKGRFTLETIEMLEGIAAHIGSALMRKQAEAELKDRERRLQQIFDILPIGLWFADETGKLIMGNPAGVKIWGAEPTVGIEKYGIFKARRLPEYKEIEGEEWALAKTVKEGVIIADELLEIDALDGKKKIILNYTAPILDDENKVKGAIVINQEVTEKYRYEEKLKKSEEKYRLIAENMGNVVTMLDMDLNFTYVTPNILKIRGFTVEECLNQKIEESMTPESLQQVARLFQEELAIEMSGTGDLQRSRVLDLEEYCKDGSTIWMENVISFVRDKSGKPIGVLAVSRDITERIVAEAEKKRLMEQLMHAQKMESVGTLAGGIAHDFNNLLQVIGGYTGIILQERNNSPKDIERLKEVEKAVDRGSSLVMNLLTFSRKTGSSRKIIDLNEEVETVEKLLRSILPKMIEIKIDINPKIRKIEADPIQIEQILLNLSKNSADAMPEGGTITIKTDNVDINDEVECCCGGITPGEYVLLSMEDTGTGIDPELINHIFDPFFTTKEVGKGTGLGLATAYGIVVNHGGHIHCESEKGIGTKFLIYLPVTTEIKPEKKIITEKTETRDGSETIMIVDDESAIRELQSDTLKEFGYKVITAESGEEALTIYSEKGNDIDLIVMDLGMPGMGGEKCLSELKKIYPQIKVIIASGYSTTEQTEELLAIGASGFVAKPYKLKSMLDTIREVLDKN